jgi:hypothetical protein
MKSVGTALNLSMMGLGVPTGAKTANQGTRRNLGCWATKECHESKRFTRMTEKVSPVN